MFEQSEPWPDLSASVEHRRSPRFEQRAAGMPGARLRNAGLRRGSFCADRRKRGALDAVGGVTVGSAGGEHLRVLGIRTQKKNKGQPLMPTGGAVGGLSSGIKRLRAWTRRGKKRTHTVAVR